MRALAAQTGAQFESVASDIEAASLASEAAALAPMQEQAELLRMSKDYRDPLIEEGITQGLREQAEMQKRKADVAAGPTGVSRGDSSLLALRALSQGLLQSKSAHIQRHQANVAALSDMIKAQGSLRSSYSQARTSAISSLQAQRLSTVASLQQAAIELDQQPSVLASMLAGGISSFAGSTGGSELIGAGIGGLFKKSNPSEK